MHKITYQNRKKSGFTIIEIIVVITIIAILATISVFGYGSWRASVAEKEVKSDLTNVEAAMENARTFNNAYPTSIPATFTASNGVELTYDGGDGTRYCVTGKSKSVSSVVFNISSNATPKISAGQCTSNPSNPSPTSPVIAAPETPSNFTVSVDGTNANSTWSASARASRYTLDYKNSTSSTWISSSVTSASNQTASLTPSQWYDFRVQALNDTGGSAWTSTIKRVIVPAPTNLSYVNYSCAAAGTSDYLTGGKFSWTGTTNTVAVEYELNDENDKTSEYSATSKFIQNTSNATSPSFTAPTRSDGYYYQGSRQVNVPVRGIGPNGEKSQRSYWTKTSEC